MLAQLSQELIPQLISQDKRHRPCSKDMVTRRAALWKEGYFLLKGALGGHP